MKAEPQVRGGLTAFTSRERLGAPSAFHASAQ